MGKTLLLKRKLTMLLLFFAGIVSAGAADASGDVLLEADFTTDQSSTEGWTTVDKSTKEGTTWTWSQNVFGTVGYKYISGVRIVRDWDALDDDYFISTAVELKAGTTYTITTQTGKNNAGILNLEVGTSLTDMSTFKSLKTLSPISIGDALADEETTFTPEADGTYYFAFHAIQETEGSDYMYIFGIKVAVPGTGGGSTKPDQPETPAKKALLDTDFTTLTEAPADWNIVDNNNDEKKFAFYKSAIWDQPTFKYYPAMQYNQSRYYDSVDDYIVSPALELKKGVKYTVTTGAQYNYNPANITLELGTSATDMSTFSAKETIEPSSTFADREKTFELTVDADGTYYLAYHVYQTDGMQRMTWITGLKVEAEEGGSTDPTEPGTDEPEAVLDADFSTDPGSDWAIIDKSSSTGDAWNFNGYAFYDTAAYKYFPGMRILQSTYNSPQDDWLISPDLNLKKGYKYTATTASTREKESATLTLELGQSRSDVSGFKALDTLTPATTYTDDRFKDVEFTVEEDGVYNLAYHVYEDPSMSSDNRKQKTYVFGLKVVGEKSTAPEPVIVTPADVADLMAEYDKDNTKVTLSWTNPTKDADGNDLTVKVGAKVYEGETLIETINELEGETTSKTYVPGEPLYATHIYTVKTFVGDKEAEGKSVNVVIEKPKVAPANVEDLISLYSEVNKTITLSWTNPTKDANGDELTEKAGAKVYEGETLIETIDELEGDNTTKVYTPAEPLYAKHTYTVKTFVGDKESEGRSTIVDLTGEEPKDVPYTANLTSGDDINDFSILDANNDGVTWDTTEGISGITYNSDNASVAALDNISTPAIKFEAGKNYAITAKFSRQGAFDPDSIIVRVVSSEENTEVAKYAVSDEDGLEKSVRYICNTTADAMVDFGIVTPNAQNGQISLLSVDVREIEKATPMAVENLEGVVNSNDKTVTLSWTNPTKDTEGYAIAEKLGAKIYADGELVETIDELTGETTTKVFSPATFSGKSLYSVYAFIGENNSEEKSVEVNLDDKTGEEVLVKNFSSDFDQNAWTIISGGNGGAWKFDYQDVFDFNYQRGGAVEDDWLISPAVALSAKDRFVVKYKLKTARDYDASVEVTIGAGNTVNDQTQVLASHNNLKQNGFGDFTTEQFSVPADDYYNVAFHVTNANYFVDVRGVAIYSIGEPTTPDVDPTSINAVKIGVVAYNKANGTLFVPAGSKVQVYSANGATAIDTMANGEALNLNSLAKGMYILKVTDAEGHSVSQKIAK